MSGATRPVIVQPAPGFTLPADGSRTVVVWVPKDPVRKHGNFIDKHGHAITLVSDADSNLCERYGS